MRFSQKPQGSDWGKKKKKHSRGPGLKYYDSLLGAVHLFDATSIKKQKKPVNCE